MKRDIDGYWEELKIAIDSIQKLYTEITKLWVEQENTRINLKRTLVSEIETDNEIYKQVFRYVHFLNNHSADMILFVCGTEPNPISARIKTKNSIAYKIKNYRTERHGFGKTPINKCLNDLFGLRIILNVTVTFDQIDSFIKHEYGSKYRCINSSKLDYKAIHLYFKENNYTFPWELQIWNQCDKENNLASHAKYKQGYTKWEHENEEGGEDIDH